MPRITAISDLHGHFPKLPGGDLLIVAGDLTGKDSDKEHLDFIEWMHESNYKKKIYCPGNHDNFLFDIKRHGKIKTPKEWNIEYLCDYLTEFEGLKIYGIPWTYRFKGINPKCCAFTCAEDDHEFMMAKCEAIPDDTDILITHGPPLNILDETIDGRNVGCQFLREHVIARVKPKLHLFGHIHEMGSRMVDTVMTKFANCSYVDEKYKPRGKIMEFEL